MALLRPITGALLAGIVITAHLALVKQAEWNGTFNLHSLLTYTTRTLPNTAIPIRLPSTNLPQLDNYFAFMTSFFWTTLDARNVRAHWAGNHLLGTLSSIWLVMLAEVNGEGSGLVAWTFAAELLGEFFGIGVFTGVWGVGHLLFSRKDSGKGKENLRALGWGLVLGHVVPTVLMLRLKPDGEGFWASQQIWTVARLFHPVFLAGFWTVFKAVLPSAGGAAGGSAVGSRRTFYVFSILASAFFHVTSLGFLLAPEMFPGWLDPAVSKALDPATVLIPTPFWSEAVVQKVDFETGVAVFLQWDYLCSAAAIVVWATAMYLEAVAGNKAVKKGGLELVVQTLGVGVLAGPGAAAAFLMLERDGVGAEAEVIGEKKTL
ncbi:hypothetical protein M409DRAFT_27456 [Zasmidium cellare ATCC 36951]|uniref:Uncharacterized protein n=1 Tax=Zasmidium cellare ATCC 36951 TaxID=1080233 RepID=A0A6A6C746_ZASCE|nr:uncharacterized protein M409DRAFT_27456 [Zasmidium cellare ATCC 36951]KAF2162078.1 hypothetical protein M409DRAFT_27456 [Zasmidium cellare ATCC 36951]